METDEIEILKTIKRLTSNCFTALRSTEGKHKIHTAEIKVYDYYELASVIRNLMKLCIVALDHDGAEIPITIENQSIDVGLILGIALQLFPIDEFELLNEINILFAVDSEKENETVLEK
ncbi:hypothetical protein SAMN06265349_102989 [Flavobacterium resistens]|uniref:Uncharacterized protein n=1 Tax=Flavobacterium resistens TaxID=443612 RepID=A0A521CW63_9FLAO|nr:hypothetical protein [Flavobacterium resistens]MRX67056.1 hypothetical protein [Flavobacterium resistens]SMO63686.1 hypothetical protein SAMN06265349_102989 [Flavobacterium resistens]